MTVTRDSSAARRWTPLTVLQRRVLGVLIEKARTTPAAYPMTVNAIVVGSNQKNNREPLMSLDDIDVSNTLNELVTLKVVSEMDWLGRVPKYKHNAYEWLGVNTAEMAVMAELLLRGAQALGDLRARAARMESIADLTALKPIVEGLVARGLMIELAPPGRGQIVSHNLYTAPERAELSAAPAPHAHAETGAGGAPAARGSELDALREEVAQLRERVAALEARLRGTPD